MAAAPWIAGTTKPLGMHHDFVIVQLKLKTLCVWGTEQAPVNCEFYLYVCLYFCREITDNAMKEEGAT